MTDTVTDDVVARHADAADDAFSTDAYDLLVGGEWVQSESDETIPVRNPATGQEHATVQSGVEADVDRAVTAAEEGFEEWSSYSPRKRASLMRDAADAIRDERDRLTAAITLDAGRPIREASAEVPQVADRFDYFAGLARDLTGETIPAESYDIVTTYREPYGVVGAIVPWNIPLMLAANKLGPALAAGNSVVLKPAEQASAVVLEFARLVDDALPDGVVNVVTGYGEPVGEPLVRHPAVRKVAFTGSAQTGKRVMKVAADDVTDVTLELGGKGAAVVFPDADLEKAVEDLLMGIFYNAGQICGATARLYLHEDIAEAFTDRFVAKTAEITVGDPLQRETEMGPIVDRDQFERVRTYVEGAVEDGATLLTGGEAIGESVPGGGYYIEPTVLTDVDDDAPIACEEVFGPVQTVFTWHDYDEVIQRANDSPYGLTAGVWTNDYRTLVRATRDLEVGTVTGNLAHRLPTEMPYGGVKESGTGRENGREVLGEYTQLKSLNADLRDEPVGLY